MHFYLGQVVYCFDGGSISDEGNARENSDGKNHAEMFATNNVVRFLNYLCVFVRHSDFIFKICFYTQQNGVFDVFVNKLTIFDIYNAM